MGGRPAAARQQEGDEPTAGVGVVDAVRAPDAGKAGDGGRGEDEDVGEKQGVGRELEYQGTANRGGGC